MKKLLSLLLAAAILAAMAIVAIRAPHRFKKASVGYTVLYFAAAAAASKKKKQMIRKSFIDNLSLKRHPGPGKNGSPDGSRQNGHRSQR